MTTWRFCSSHPARAVAVLVAIISGAACSAKDDLVVGSRAANGGSSAIAQGGRSGTVSVRPTAGAAGAMATQGLAGTGANDGMAPPKPFVIDETGKDNPAGLSPAEVTELAAGGPNADMKWLYPYDGTVFPGGTIAPLVMWTGNPAPDAVYFHMKSQAFEYKGVLKPAVEGALYTSENTWAAFAANSDTFLKAQQANKQLAIPQKVWDAAGRQTLGKGDTFLLEVTERVNGQIHGPVFSHITIARGNLQGSVYYNTCWSGTATNSVTAGLGSMVMRIPPGGNARPVTASAQCLGCHSVSADGSRLVAQRAFALGDLSEVSLTGKYPVYAWSIRLGPDALPDPSTNTHFGTMGSYGALYPDGSKYLTTSGKAGIVAFAQQVVPLSAAVLLDSTTGAVIPDTGIPPSASMPSFSPDGTRLVFNDVTLGNAHGLATMAYDTRNHKASGYEVLMQNVPGKSVLLANQLGGDARPGWPFFLPDSRAVVFVQTTSADFTSGTNVFDNSLANMAANDPNRDPRALFPSDLYIADVATGTVTLLAKAMGFNTPADTGATYLPFGEADLHRNYFPTVLPVASGGYFWVFFDSLRNFGSMGAMRSLWGAAIDIHPDGSYTTDPSHPPFYLPGQEFISSSHHRAFAALDSCKPDGAKCATGIDCCGGRCPEGTCVPPAPPGEEICAKRDERCASSADCCDSSNLCLNNFCAFVELL